MAGKIESTRIGDMMAGMKVEDPRMSLGDALGAHSKEIVRYLKLSEGWNATERYSVLCGWMGTNRMREMNDFLATKYGEPK